MSQVQLDVKELESTTAEIINKIRELGLDKKLGEEAERLENIAYDLKDWVERLMRFTIRPTIVDPASEWIVDFVVEGYAIRRHVRVGRFGEAKIADIYMKFFEDASVFSELLKKYVETLRNIAIIVRDHYDLLKQVERLISDP
jgi:hypothetical protein